MACKPSVFFASVAPAHVYCRFRWVDCQLGYLRRCLPGRIRRALEELPETLDGTYERALRDLSKPNWEFACRLLQFVAVASRPLRVEELAQFLGFDFTTGPVPEFQQDWLPEDPVDAILSTTSSLLATVNLDDSQVIQFSHFSVKEFLTSSRLAETRDSFVQRYHISMTEAHTIATRGCLGMLLHLDENITIDGLDKFPLAEYAAEHWVGHARFEDVSLKAEDGMKQLFDPNSSHFAVWVWIHDMEDQYWHREKRRDCPSPPRGTSLHYASLCGLDAIVKFLVIDHLQDVDSRGFDDGSTALHLASKKGYAEVARFLLDNGADGNARDKRKSTPLHEASIGGHAEVVRVLMERVVDVTAENDDGFKPAPLAVLFGRTEVTRVFLEFGVDDDISGWPPLHRALFEGRTETARVLIKRGADITHKLEDDTTPFQVAVLGGHVASIRVLLEHGLDLKAKDIEVDIPFRLACMGGHIEVVRLLLEHGADAKAQGDYRVTPLHIVALSGGVEAARLLLERGANVTACDEDGNTPLHFAAIKGHVELASLLLDCGADTTAQSNDGPTPLQVAEATGNVELTRLLLERGTDAKAQADDGRVSIPITADQGYVEPSLLLPEPRAVMTAQTSNELTPSNVTAAEGHVEHTPSLSQPRLDATTHADDGQTPLRMAPQREHEDVGRALPDHGTETIVHDDQLWCRCIVQ